jgi:hypothetical protein
MIPPRDWPNAVGQDVVVREAQSPNRKDTLPSSEAKMRRKPIQVSRNAGLQDKWVPHRRTLGFPAACLACGQVQNRNAKHPASKDSKRRYGNEPSESIPNPQVIEKLVGPG